MSTGSASNNQASFLMTAWDPAASGGYAINTFGNLVLNSNYVTAVTNLANALDTSNYNSLFNAFVASYG